jgi:DNA-binding NarL/FixJ family response regulator
LALLERQAFDAVVADSKMPRGNGIDFLVTVRDRFPTVRRILYTGAPPEGVHRFIDEGTVQRCLLKPLGGHAFIAALKSELDLPRWNQR